MTRNELARDLAMDRAEYELYVEAKGYGPEAMQPLVPFVKDAAFKIARRRKVQGITVTESVYGPSFYARIDWKKLASQVERQVPSWKETIRRVEAEDAEQVASC